MVGVRSRCDRRNNSRVSRRLQNRAEVWVEAVVFVPRAVLDDVKCSLVHGIHRNRTASLDVQYSL